MRMTVNDERQLRVLAVVHYFYGWLVALGGLITFMLVVGKIGLGPELVTDEGALGGFIIASLVGFLLIALLAAATIVAGKRLECHTHRVYCVIVAAINILFVPSGTALGIVTIVTLMRPSVVELFESTSSSPPQAGEYAPPS